MHVCIEIELWLRTPLHELFVGIEYQVVNIWAIIFEVLFSHFTDEDFGLLSHLYDEHLGTLGLGFYTHVSPLKISSFCISNCQFF